MKMDDCYILLQGGDVVSVNFPLSDVVELSSGGPSEC